MSERGITHEIGAPTTKALPSMAARAVALCEGCPMAKFCTTKQPGNCPPEIQQFDGIVEQAQDMPERPKSYLKDLLDDRKPVVMATPKRVAQTKNPQRPITRPPGSAANQQMVSRKPIVAQQAVVEESIPQKVADVIMDMFGVNSIKRARVKK